MSIFKAVISTTVYSYHSTTIVGTFCQTIMEELLLQICIYCICNHQKLTLNILHMLNFKFTTLCENILQPLACLLCKFPQILQAVSVMWNKSPA